MLVNKLNVEDQVLSTDLQQAELLTYWADYCLAQLDKCLAEKIEQGVKHWGSQYESTINDLKYLQFKKTDHERKMKIEKGN